MEFVHYTAEGLGEFDPTFRNVIYHMTLYCSKDFVLELVAEVRRQVSEGANQNSPGMQISKYIYDSCLVVVQLRYVS